MWEVETNEKMKKGELVKKVILAAGAGVAIGAVMLVPPLAITFKAIMEIIMDRPWEKERLTTRKVRRVLYNLEKKNLVSLKRVDEDLLVTFNDEGKKLLVKYKFDDLTIPKPEVWDRSWRIVIFDIPEKRKKAREVLREKLESLGFNQLQKSVFVYPYECQKEIDLVAKIYEIEPYVFFIRANYIDSERLVKAKFDLA